MQNNWNNIYNVVLTLVVFRLSWQEREEKETLRQEIDRLREALVSYAEAAASRESPLRGSTELTAMFNRLTAVRSIEEAIAASVK